VLKLPTINNLSIYLIGTGGTGGFAFTNLARLLAGANVPISIFDGDIVEPKNLKRQQFGKADIDSPKAQALADWASYTILDCPPIGVINDYVTDSDELLAGICLSTPDDAVPLIISAVDNVATRKLINQALEDLPEYIAIDSGNHDQGGQVVLTTNLEVVESQGFETPKQVKLANMLQVYPEIANIDDKNPGLEQSCDDVVESEPQAMMANSRNGDIIANLVMSILGNKSIAGNVFESSLADFSTKVRTVTL
jgi:hypothetical protein